MAEAKAQNRYRVIERLESGGMAEVFRGEAESLAGFKKGVAIKRVLPHLAQNEKFIRMFLDEARLCARLNHANIVQVFDIGHVENTYFIVMEFVDGVNLKAVIEFMRKRSVPVPIPVATFITIEVCNGLQYAHDLTDSDGALLNIVHRDISPPNVLISKRGEIKLVDFGLAKAAHQVEKTEPGVVKGKFSYLAPETAMGQEAGPQADVFAAGIMLWEMLAGRRLFMGESDFQTVRLVQQANIPPLRKINAEVPEQLEAVILKSLAKERSARYPSAQAFAEDLAQFLFSHQMRVTGFDIAKIVREVVEEKKAQAKREGKQRDASIIDKLIQEELLRFTSLGEGPGEAANASGEPSTTNAPPVAEGAAPLDPGVFENPTDWFKDGVGDFDPEGAKATSGWHQPGRDGPGNLADQLESEDLSPPQNPPLSSEFEEEAATTVMSAQAVKAVKERNSKEPPKETATDTKSEAPVTAAKTTELETKTTSKTTGATSQGPTAITTTNDEKKPDKKTSPVIYVVALLAVVGVGAVLFLTNVIPH